MASINQKPSSIELSIVIISYNTKQITTDCIESIYQTLINSPLNFEVIVVDNASSDGSVEQLKKLTTTHKNLKLIENKHNRGFGPANNQGVEQARGEYILLLNSDIIVLDNAIGKLFTFYQQNKETMHFIGGKLLNKDKTPQTSVAPFYNLFYVIPYMFLRGDHWGITRSSPDIVKKVDWVSGACIMTKKQYFQNLGGFDEKVFMYMEEVDLLYRAKKRGYSTYFFPGAQFIHLGFASSGGRSQPIVQVFKGLLYFYKKHYGPLSVFFLRIMLQLKALIALLIGKITHNKYLLETYAKAYKIASLD